jgi:AcrR family transcriptional regulator
MARAKPAKGATRATDANPSSATYAAGAAGAAGVTGARREAILEAATGVFLRYGFRKTSMDDLARAAGLSRQGLYLHFANKDALFGAAVLRLVEVSRTAARAALARDDLELEARLLGAFEAHQAGAVGESAEGHLSELLETAKALVGPVMRELEEEFVAGVTRVLKSAGVAAGWKEAGISAKELAEHLNAASSGVKHVVTTAAAYRERMRVAIRIACRGARR